MPSEPAWRRYLRLWGPDVRADIDDEFAFHIETRAAEHVAAGVPEGEARARALAEFGDLAAARRRCRTIGEQRERRRRWAERVGGLGADLRLALRLFVRAPATAAGVVLTLALGIGATTAMYSAVHGVLLRPLPYAYPERVARLWEVSPRGDDQNVVSPGNVVSWRERSTSFAGLAAHSWPYDAVLTGAGDAARVSLARLTPSVLTVLGVAPLAGRAFAPADGEGDGRVVMLGEELWRTRFGGAADVVGRRIALDEQPYTVIGVVPASFDFPDATAQLWTVATTAMLDRDERRSHNWGVVARLRPGVPFAAADAELRGIAASLAVEHPQFMTGWSARVVPLHDDLVAPVRPLLLVLLGGAALVLLVACVNIANLLLARAVSREREIAVRGALGAGRWRLVRQLLAESLVLAAAGGALGVLVAAALHRWLLALAPADMPLAGEIRLSLPVLAFAALATLASTLAFGLVPALRLSRTDLQSTIRAAHDRGGGVRHARLRALLLVGEVGLSLLLLVGAGLLVRSAQRLAVVDYGFRPDGLLTATATLPGARYDTLPRQLAYHAALMARVAALPGVTAVAGTSAPPAAGRGTTFSFAIEGRPSSNPSGREDPQQLRAVTPDYFRTLGVPLVRGRAFLAGDVAEAPPVAIVNEALARRHWPDGDAVGERISFAGAGGPWLEIVGVVGDTRLASPDQPPAPALYIPYAQKAWPWMTWLTLLVRAADDRRAEALAPAVRQAARELDAALPLSGLETVNRRYAATVAPRRFAMTLLVGFAGLALLLATIGIYGVLAYGVAQRRQEIGIRIALGAARGDVVLDVLRQALGLTVTGLLLGGVAALALAPVLRGLLYGVPPTDVVSNVAAGVVLLAVAAVAAWLPARRAATVDPVRAIRDG